MYNPKYIMHACMLGRFSHVWLFVTPWTVVHLVLLSTWFSRQEYWSGLPCPPPGNLPNPGIEPCLSVLLHWQAGSLQLALPGKPYFNLKKDRNRPLHRLGYAACLAVMFPTEVFDARLFNQHVQGAFATQCARCNSISLISCSLFESSGQ